MEICIRDVSGGSVLLPISNSTMFVTDPADPIMAGLPASFLQGPRAAFAVSNFNSDWLHASANFISSGYLGRVPAGTYPAVLSGRCGTGRVVLFTMNHLQVIGGPPANQMINNALHWLVGN